MVKQNELNCEYCNQWWHLSEEDEFWEHYEYCKQEHEERESREEEDEDE